MMRHRLLLMLAILGIVPLIAPTAVVWSWHGTGGPTGTGVAVGPTFSKPLASLLPGRGFTTCILGNFRAYLPNYLPPPDCPDCVNPGHDAEHHWKYLSRVSGNVTLLLTVQSFNTDRDPGKTMTLTANHASGTSSVTVVYPETTGDAGEVFGTLTVPVAAGVMYDLTVTPHQRPDDPTPDNEGSVHYRLGVLGPGANQVELAYGEPTLEYQEPVSYRWAFNVAASETAKLEISVDPYVDRSGRVNAFVPRQAMTFDYAILDPALARLYHPRRSLRHVLPCSGPLFAAPDAGWRSFGAAPGAPLSALESYDLN